MGLRTVSLMVQMMMVMCLISSNLIRNLFRVFQQTRCPNFVLTFVGGVEMMIISLFHAMPSGIPTLVIFKIFLGLIGCH